MKKFKFSLESVLKYKNQVLDGLKAEHGALMAAVHKQEAVVNELKQECASINHELNDKNKLGITPQEMIQYKQYIHRLQQQIREQNQVLHEIRKKEEAKKGEVVEMKKETASFDLIKEKKIAEYNISVQKEEEARVDELVSNQRYRDSRG